MIRWILVLQFVSNFCFGALIPIIPVLNLESAGWAFTAFSLFKCLAFAPSGIVADRLGNRAAVGVSLLLQALAMGTLIALPGMAWLGRMEEGIGLALGTIACLGWCRELAPDPGAFARLVQSLLSVGGLGYIVGPLAGFALSARFGTGPVLWFLLIVNGTACLGQFAWGAHPGGKAVLEVVQAPVPEASHPGREGGLRWKVALGAAKCLGLGWQPVLGWWAIQRIGLSPVASGLSFLVLGAGFSLGAKWRIRGGWILGALGFVCLELSLRSGPTALIGFWWGAVAMLGVWFGRSVTESVGRLGWNSPESLGKLNARWLLATDLPAAFVPVVLWQFRDDAGAPWRWGLGGVLLLVSTGASVLPLKRHPEMISAP